MYNYKFQSGELDLPPGCECDNTHEQNNTVCRFCWAKGRRIPSDPDFFGAATEHETTEEHHEIEKSGE
jgi:hypothetical protein